MSQLEVIFQKDITTTMNFQNFLPFEQYLIFILSILFDNPKVFGSLIQSGLDVNLTSKESGNSALHFCCMNGYYKSTIKLLNYGADPSIKNKVIFLSNLFFVFIFQKIIFFFFFFYKLVRKNL